MLTLLIAEENNEIRLKLKTLLGKDFNIFEAENGINALEISSREQISLFIVNNSITLLKKNEFIKKFESTNVLPILYFDLDILEKNEESKGEMLDLEVNKLINNIRLVKKKYYGHSDDSRYFKYYDLILDYYTKKVYIKEVELKLTPKEFDLLIYLIINKNTIHSRDFLLKEVWGYEFPGNSRTVDTHIKSLRNKLENYRDLIITIWGKGYKMEFPQKIEDQL